MKDSGIPWIGQIPEHWKAYRFKDFLILESEVSSINKIGLENIEPENGKFVITESKFDGQGTHFIPNDIIYGKLRPYLRKVWVADFEGSAVGDFYVFRCKECICPIFIKYVLLSDGFTKIVLSSVYGSKMPRVASDFILNLPFFLPLVEEQEAIAAYLDKKCGEIDELIEVEQQMISDLESYRKSVITEAVTHGLNLDAELKESGIYWIGNIPERWTIAKMKFFVDISNGSDSKTEGDIPVFGSGATSFKTCGEFKEGPTVLIGRKGATLHIPHYIEGNYWNVDTAFDTKVKNYSLKYFFYIASILDYKAYISATTLPSMTQSNYENMQIPVPPLSEQLEIAEYLDAKCVDIDELIKVKQEKIETLKQYRQSLIFEAVTGKTTIA